MTKRNSKENGVQLPFNHDGFIEKWQEWLQYRKERRLPAYVPTGLKKTFTMLKRISLNSPEIAMQIIDQSISNNYQGLFELKPSSNATNITNTPTGIRQGGVSNTRIQAAKDF